jgi:hypothetical protein
MKGVVFTEFLEMAENHYSLAVVDEVIQRAGLSSGGVYTSVGTYPAQEMVSLVTELSAATNTPVPLLLREFGRYLLHRFARGFPQFFEKHDSALDFLEGVEGVIHVEVRKLYTETELPTFECKRNGDRLTMTYRSPRRLADLAEGLMQGCAEHFQEKIDIARDDLSGGSGEVVRFTLDKRGPA